jgi:hypothetical protein
MSTAIERIVIRITPEDKRHRRQGTAFGPVRV